MSSDDEELAAMRRQRASRLGEGHSRGAESDAAALRAQLPASFGGGGGGSARKARDFSSLVSGAPGGADEWEPDDEPGTSGGGSGDEASGGPEQPSLPATGGHGGLSRSPPASPASPSSSGSSLSSSDDEDEGPKLPISQRMDLEPHTRAVSAVAFDDAGARLATGGLDYTVRLFDFGGMAQDGRAFASVVPEEGQPVVALDWAPGGEQLLVVTASSQPRLLSRDGRALGAFPKGDMYVQDARNTKGHVGACTGGAWRPEDAGTVLTSSLDGTVRMWDPASLKQRAVIKPPAAVSGGRAGAAPGRGASGRAAVTSCAFSHDGGSFFAGTGDGALAAWDARAPPGRSAAVSLVAAPRAQMLASQDWTFAGGETARAHCPTAHEPGTAVTGLAVSRGGALVASRGADGTVRLWDSRLTAQPLWVTRGLPNNHDSTSIVFSPDERVLATGTSAKPPGAGDPDPSTPRLSGGLVFLDRATGGLVAALDAPAVDGSRAEVVLGGAQSSRTTRTARANGPGGALGSDPPAARRARPSTIAVAWHPRLNQLVAGGGDRDGGGARIWYDPAVSQRGALLASARPPKKATPFAAVSAAKLEVYLPNALPAFRTPFPGQRGAGGKRKGGAEVLDPSDPKARRPDPGSSRAGVGAGGVLGSTGGTLLTQHVLKKQGKVINPSEEDVVAALLRHEGTEDAISGYTRAYRETQPDKIFDTTPEEGEED